MGAIYLASSLFYKLKELALYGTPEECATKPGQSVANPHFKYAYTFNYFKYLEHPTSRLSLGTFNNVEAFLSTDLPPGRDNYLLPFDNSIVRPSSRYQPAELYFDRFRSKFQPNDNSSFDFGA